DSSLNITGVYRSTDASANWTSLGAPAGLTAGDVGQHAFSMLGDPVDNQAVYIAGLGTVGPDGATFRYDPSLSQWVNLTGAGAMNTQPHPDVRDLAFLGATVLVEACDGGLYFLSNPQNAAANQWQSLNGEGTAGQGLGNNEVHNIAWDSNSKVLLAAAQDDGSSYSQVINTNSQQISGGVWTQINGGDGGDVAVDNFTLAGAGQSIRFSASQGNSTPPLNSLTRQAFDSSGAPLTPPVYIAPVGLAGFSGLFITPTVLNTIGPTAAELAAGQSTRMVIGGYQSANPIYESNNVGSAAPNAIVWTAVPIAPGFGNTVTALAYGGMRQGAPNPDVLYAAGNSNLVYVRTTAGGTLNPTPAAFPGGSVRGISLDPTDWMHAYVIGAAGVWETTDAGGSWIPRTGNLVNSNLRSVEYVHLPSGDVVLAGGQGGIYRMFADNPGVWTKLGLNLPNTIAYDINYSAASDVLAAGTFGRGVWTISNAAAQLSAPPVMQITGDQDVAGEDDTFRLVRDANNPLLLDVFVNNNTIVPDQQLPLASLNQINIDGLGGDDTLVIDDSNGLINVPGGIHYDGGTGFNKLSLVQTGGAVHTSDVYSVGPNNGEGSDVISDAGVSNAQSVYFQNLAPVLDTVLATTATVNGTSSDNAINYAQGSVVANGLITIDNQESYEFSNKTNLVIFGGAGSDTINLNNPSKPTSLASITINGNDPTASDTLIVNGIAGVNDDLLATPTGAGSGTVSDAPAPTFVPVTFNTIEHLNLVGQTSDADGADISSTAGDDAYTYTPGGAGGSGIVTGTANSGAFDLVPVSLSGFRSFITPLAFNSGGIDQLTINGTAADDTFGLSIQAFPPGGSYPAVIVNGSSPLFFSSGLANLVLNGLGGNDAVNVVTAAALPKTAVHLNSSLGGNILNVIGDGSAPLTVDLANQKVLEAGYNPISFSGVSQLNVGAGGLPLNLLGSATSDDNLSITPSGTQSGSFQDNGVGPVVSFGLASAVNVDLQGGNNTLAVNGSTADDPILATNGQVQVGVNVPVNYVVNRTAALDIHGLGGNDVLTVDSTAGAVVTPIYYDGGVGSNALRLIDGAHTAASDVYSPGPNPGQGLNRLVIGGNAETVHFVNLAPVFDNVAGPLVVNGTNGDDAISYSQGAVPANGLVSVNNLETIEFTGKTSLAINTGLGKDTVSLNNSSVPSGLSGITVTGGDPNAGDVLISSGSTAGGNVLQVQPTGAGAGVIRNFGPAQPPVAFGGIGSVQLVGGGTGNTLFYSGTAGNDTIQVSPGSTPYSGSLFGSNGSYSLIPVSFSGIDTQLIPGTASGTGTGGGNDTIVLNGTAGNDTFKAYSGGGVPLFTVQTPAGTMPQMFVDSTGGTAKVVFSGDGGSDTFATDFTTLDAYAGIQYSIVGNNGAADTLNFTANAGATTTVDLATSTITSVGANPVSFSGLANVNINAQGGALKVQGTAGADAFSFTPTGAAAGSLTDGGLSTTFSFSAVGGAGFTLDPSGGDDSVTVIGTNGNDVFNVSDSTVQAVGLLPVQLATANVKSINVSALAGNDAFNVTPSGAVPISIDGGDPIGVSPPLAPPNGDQINILAGGSSVAYSQGPHADEGGFVIGANQPVSFTHVERATVSNPGPVVISGTSGDDTITVTAIDAANQAQFGAIGADGVQDYAVQMSNALTLAFVNSAALQINSLAGNDDIVVQAPAPLNENWNVSVGIDGGPPVAGGGAFGDNVSIETLGTAAQTVSFTPSSSNGGLVGLSTISSTISLTNVENLVLNGSGNNDPLTINGSGGADAITATPGPATDGGVIQVGNWLGLTYQALGGGGSVTVNGNGGSDMLTVYGTSANDALSVSATGAVTLNANLPIQQTGITKLVLNGLAGDDVFNLAGALPYVSTTVNGGEPSASDIVNLSGATGLVSVNLADPTLPSDTAITGYGGTITLSGVEVANLDANGNGLTITGTAQDDAINYKPSGAAAGAVTSAGLNTAFNFSNATGTFTIDPAGGNDTVTVNGTSGNDSIAVVRGAATTVQVNSLKTASITTSNTEALVVSTGLGADQAIVSGTAGPASLTVNGGASPATDTVTINNSTAGVTTVVPGATPDAGKVQTPDGNVAFTGMTTVTLTGASAGDTLVARGTNAADNLALQFLGGANRIWVNNQAVVNFSSFGTVSLQGLFGDDQFSVAPSGLVGVTNINVAGGDPTGSDSLLVDGTSGPDVIDYAPSAADAGSVTVNGLPIAFSTTEAVSINGLGGGDSLTVTTPAGPDAISYAPGATVDSASVRVGSLTPLSFNNLGAGGISLADAGGVQDSLRYSGTSGSDTFQLAGGVITLNNQLPVTTPGIAAATLLGLDGDDTFDVSGALPFATTTLDGGNPSASDIANFTGAVGNVTVNLGDSGVNPPTNTTITGYGGTIALTGVEAANLDVGGNSLVANGTSHNDVITYTPGGAAEGAFVKTSLNTAFNFTNAAGAFTINGGAGVTNTVNVDGADGRDLFVIREDLRTVSVTDASGALLKPVVLGPDVQILSAFGLGGQDTFQVTPFVGSQYAPNNLDNLLVNVDGGPGGENNALVIQSGGGGPLDPNQFIVVNRGATANTGTVRPFTAAVQWPDINYSNVQVVSPHVAAPSDLLFMGPDLNEANETQFGATILGSAGTIQVPHATIFSNTSEFPGVPADNDYYSVTAEQTGTLDFVATFHLFSPSLLPAGGNINLQA
ncbi:MAG TPA: hypothetical protein VHC19_23755, partial [Pirellulales bacterium]|nr:hypothetical protein [Pirellulales bacterium]